MARGFGDPGLGLVCLVTRLGRIRTSRILKASVTVPSLVPVPLSIGTPLIQNSAPPFLRPAASQPTMATATLWNFQFSANVQVVTEAQRPWSDIMAEEL